MSYSNGERLRARRLGILVLSILTTLSSAVVASAQSLPTTVTESAVSPYGDYDASASVAMDKLGRFIIAWQEDTAASGELHRNVLIQRYASDGTAIGSAYALTAESPSIQNGGEFHNFPSIAMSRNGQVRVGWQSWCLDTRPQPGDEILTSDFTFATDPTPVQTGNDFPSSAHHQPYCSVGACDAFGVVSLIGENTLPYEGLLYGESSLLPDQLDECGVDCWEAWAPCVSMRSTDGIHAVVWAEPELNEQDPPLNIKLQVFNASGIALLTEPLLVNDPDLELWFSHQSSPAVALDEAGNIVVVWVGPHIDGCDDWNRLYARRLKLEEIAGGGWQVRDPDPQSGEGRPGLFIVDHDRSIGQISTLGANPSVALWINPDLTQADPREGSFVIAWNSTPIDSAGGEIHAEIHARYFNALGLAKGGEFRVNQADGEDGYALLAKSGQHTLVYGPEEQVVAVWTEGYPHYHDTDGGDGVHFTFFPPGYEAETVPDDCPQCVEDPDLCLPCLQADINDDCTPNGLDIAPFVDLLIQGNVICLNARDYCAADTNRDGAIDVYDIPCFVARLLDLPCSIEDGASEDCNSNLVPDVTDIALGTSEDANGNGIPDECDITLQLSGDLNTNGIPDESEQDLNGNGVPDDVDIASATSTDLNSNGVPDEAEDCNGNGYPDEWEIAQSISADCNNNGTPDDCDDDCNANGVPDDCEIDPTDPDGDGLVSPDCNGNGFPDACDFDWLLMFSLDCNENGVPDECDIASGTSQDCNNNGFPDECDLASSISDDTNSNGVPDECESLMPLGSPFGGGLPLAAESYSFPLSGGFAAPLDETEAWAEFYTWHWSQQWGSASPLTGAEQFSLMVNKLQELGLPVDASSL